jgi:hypothetical protein
VQANAERDNDQHALGPHTRALLHRPTVPARPSAPAGLPYF